MVHFLLGDGARSKAKVPFSVAGNTLLSGCLWHALVRNGSAAAFSLSDYAKEF